MRSLLLPFFRAAFGLMAGSGPVHSAEVEAHVLATKDIVFVVGQKLILETTSLFHPHNHTLTVEGEEFQIEGKSSSIEVSTSECLSPTRFRWIQSKLECHTEMIVMDEAIGESTDAGPLTGLPMLLEMQEDGTFTASLEQGDPTQAQKAELAKLAYDSSSRNDLVIYGDQPRKPGEKWDVDVTKLSDSDPAGKARGTMTVEFVETKDYEGVRCAILKITQDLIYTVEDGPEEGTFTIKGEELTYRSLADKIDLHSEFKGCTSTPSEIEGLPHTVIFPTSMITTAKFDKPER